MCIVCDYYDAGFIDGDEALANAEEMVEVIGLEHSKEVKSRVLNEELDSIMEAMDFEFGKIWS